MAEPEAHQLSNASTATNGAGADVATLEPDPLHLQVHLFRAVAYYESYMRSDRASGQRDETLYRRALADIRQCKQLDPSFQPDPRAFSPGFISFFRDELVTSSR